MQCIVFFMNLVKLDIHLEKITHWKKFSSERNWEQMKKLDSFCKKLSASQVNFSVEMREGKISACFSLTLTALTDNFHSQRLILLQILGITNSKFTEYLRMKGNLHSINL